MKQLIGLLGILSIFLFACEQKEKEEFKRIAEGVSYKYLMFGDGDTVKQGDHIMLYITVLDDRGDTLHYVPGYPYFVEVSNKKIDSVWMRIGEGDSVHIKCDRSLLNQYLRLYNPLQSDEGVVEIRASLQEAMTAEEAKMRKVEELSKRELKEQLELKHYLEKYGKDLEELNGIYRKILERTDGDSIKYGDQLRVAYTGKFMNGYVFDDTDSKGLTPTFRYGEDFQLLEGVQSGLKGMKEGESVKIILPSRRAFGEKGSLAGIVPPYTSVIFEIKILKIEK